MPRKPTGKPNGRPPIDIDWQQFDKLCLMQATLSEIAGWFDCEERTIENKVTGKFGISFFEYFKKKSAGGKISLRRKQYEMALSGNVSLLIWLGKQYLNQRDEPPKEETNDSSIDSLINALDLTARAIQTKNNN